MLAAYLITFFCCLTLSLVLTWFVRKFALACGWVEAPQLARHVHTVPVPRLGGVAIFGSFTTIVSVALLVPGWMGLVSQFPARVVLGLLAPALIVFLLGLYDDRNSVGPYWKFAIQGVAAVLLYVGGFGIHNLHFIFGGHELRSVIGLPLTIFWILLITNAFNLIDGLDGLAAGSALFSTLVVLVISLIVPNPIVTFLTVALAAATLGFLPFNFHPASIFLGDSGSLFIGFMLSALALQGSQKAPTMVAVAIPVVSLGLPILDVALAVTRRFLSRKPLFSADADHIHHRLLKRGFSQRDAVLILYAVTAGFGFLSLVLLQGRKEIALVLAVVGLGVFVGLQQLRYHEFSEVLATFQNLTRRRQVVANHVAIRRATESLDTCSEFRPIWEILLGTLQPIGFDGIRLQMLNPNGFSPSLFHPFCSGPNGDLVSWWSQPHVDEPSWQLRLGLVTSSQKRWGYLTLVRLSDREALSVDVNLLTQAFCTSLANAVDRACVQLEDSKLGDGNAPELLARKRAAGTTAD